MVVSENGGYTHPFLGDPCWDVPSYPLVNIQKAIEAMAQSK